MSSFLLPSNTIGLFPSCDVANFASSTLIDFCIAFEFFNDVCLSVSMLSLNWIPLSQEASRYHLKNCIRPVVVSSSLHILATCTQPCMVGTCSPMPELVPSLEREGWSVQSSVVAIAIPYVRSPILQGRPAASVTLHGWPSPQRRGPCLCSLCICDVVPFLVI